MTELFARKAVEWSRSLELFGDTPRVILGEGAGLIPLIFVSAFGWLVVQMLAVPIYRIFIPDFVRDVETVARRRAEESKKQQPEVAVKQARNDTAVRTVALVFSLFISQGSLALTWNPPQEVIADPDFGSSPQGSFYCAIAAGYFAWDIPITVFYGYGPGFMFHALAGLVLEMVGIHPFSQVVMSWANLFELSTPFLNMRMLLISSGRTGSLLFKFCERAFAAVFLFIRIIFGVYKAWEFISHVTVDLLSNESVIIRAKGQHFTIVAWTSVVLCFCMNVLNFYWFSKIVNLGSRHQKKD